MDDRQIALFPMPAKLPPPPQPPSPTSLQVGTVIMRRRKEKRINQGELARRAGITQSVLSRIELGRHERGVSLNYLYVIAQALGTSAASIIQEASDQP